MPSFSDIASKKLGDIERPKLPPAGIYKGLVGKPLEVRKQGDKWEIVDVNLKAVEGRDGVDVEDLAKFGGAAKVLVRKSFMFDTEDEVAFGRAEWDLRRFLVDHLKCCSEDESLKQGMAAALNCPVLFEVVYKADKNEEGVFHANVGKTAPVDA